MPLDETHLRSAGYGPAGFILSGSAFTPFQAANLARSYKYLNHALTLLQNGDTADRMRYLVLLAPYLGDPADASLVDLWRKKPGDQRWVWHDEAVEKLCHYLRKIELFAVSPREMTEDEKRESSQRDARVYAHYTKMRRAGRRHDKAIEMAAEEFATSTDRVELLVELRRDVKLDECLDANCTRAPYSQNYCVKHYHQNRRANLKKR